MRYVAQNGLIFYCFDNVSVATLILFFFQAYIYINKNERGYSFRPENFPPIKLLFGGLRCLQNS